MTDTPSRSGVPQENRTEHIRGYLLAQEMPDLNSGRLIDSRAVLRKTGHSPMKSERQKREEEIERLLRAVGLTGESDAAFQEKVRKAASDIEAEAKEIQKDERPQRRKLAINPGTAGVWLLALGAGLAFSMPNAGAALLLCGIAAIVWATFLKSSKK
jgi:hypothetical protein